ncbi:unnamed protein product [Dicrocoelium dendriticum]|nr:unnamed protein product [Dicrocoelium dendriticum]
MRNVSSLISGVAIFFLGAGLTFYHGILGVFHPHDVEPLYWALFVLAGSFVSESFTLALAYREARRGAKRHNFDSVRQWLSAGVDPSTSVVLLEDLAAVFGVLVAGAAMSITAWTGNALPDAIGAIVVSGILAAVAVIIIRTNTEMLIGRSIPPEKQEAVMRLMDSMKVIRGTYDIKATMIGGDAMRFKAEVDIDGRELTRRYIETLPLDALMQLFDWWLGSYLTYRVPVVVHSNPAMRMKTFSFRSDNEWLAHAAAIIWGVLSFMNKLESSALATEFLPDGKPLCMAQYYLVLGNCRIPGLTEDQIVSRLGGPSSTCGINHICVFYRNKVSL